MNIGAVEATVMSGMLAARAICGYPKKIAWLRSSVDGRRVTSAVTAPVAVGQITFMLSDIRARPPCGRRCRT